MSLWNWTTSVATYLVEPTIFVGKKRREFAHHFSILHKLVTNTSCNLLVIPSKLCTLLNIVEINVHNVTPSALLLYSKLRKMILNLIWKMLNVFERLHVEPSFSSWSVDQFRSYIEYISLDLYLSMIDNQVNQLRITEQPLYMKQTRFTMYRSQWSWSTVCGGRCSIHQGIYDRIFQITRPNIQYGNHSMLKPNGWICFVFLLRRANKLCGTASAPRGREVFKKTFRVSCTEETGCPSCNITTFRTVSVVQFLVYRKMQRGLNSFRTK